jgi:hypothetical protein
MQPSTKGYLLTNDTKEFSVVAYSEFIAVLAALRKRIWFIVWFMVHCIW